MSSVGDMQCPLSVIREFKKMAVTLLGEPRDWTEAEVSTVGNIVGEIQVNLYFSFGCVLIQWLQSILVNLQSETCSAFSFKGRPKPPFSPNHNFFILGERSLL